MLSEGSLRDRDGEEKEPPAEEDSGDAETLQGYQWLLRDLPRLPLFHSVRASTALALQQAVHMETDPQTVSAYLVYLSQHTPVEEQGQHSDLALVRGSGSAWGPSVQSRHQGRRIWATCCQTSRCGPGLAALLPWAVPAALRAPAGRAPFCPRFCGSLCSLGLAAAPGPGGLRGHAMRASRRAGSPRGWSLCRGPAHGCPASLWVLRVALSCRSRDGVRGPSPRWVGGSLGAVSPPGSVGPLPFASQPCWHFLSVCLRGPVPGTPPCCGHRAARGEVPGPGLLAAVRAPDGLLPQDVARLIVERSTIMSHLFSKRSCSAESDAVLAALLSIFSRYVRRMRKSKEGEEVYSWVSRRPSPWSPPRPGAHPPSPLLSLQSESQDQVFLRWSSGETATMHILVVHAMVILLTLGPPRGEQPGAGQGGSGSVP